MLHMKPVFLLFSTLVFVLATAQQPQDSTAFKLYRATPEKINDLVHTKLDARFNYQKSQMDGKVWVTLKPHFYATDSVSLDAKGMDIRQVAIVKNAKNTALKYNYDGMVLKIKLDRAYKGGERYTVFIDYTAKPEELEVKGSAAITDAKGLYFINPTGEDKNKPTQIWTQGETEATSVWVPTIDKPNQKTTEEISMTVPAKYVTLSNGKLVSQKKNSDGTRTDTWRMDQPHAPYLFFMGVGEYAIVRDSYKGKEVSYYVEKEYAPVARKIFGMTPEMIALYSKLLGVEYPWVKYAQIVGRDYVSGAMENTTATLHGESAQQDARELTDGNRWEEVIAHELFHQWFGDYTTAESWSNITMNESFATIGSQLWNEYKYGKDAANEERYNSIAGYLSPNNFNRPLVRFHYNDKEDVFDAVSYNKGGAILQMLRNFVGDSAFYKSLNLFLTRHKYEAVEPQQLRLAFEEVTGKDLNWFFNQWYYGSGHPRLNITSSYNNTARLVQVVVEQTQPDKLFTVPVKIDVWTGNSPVTYSVWLKSKVDTFNFPAATQPSLVNFDADKMLVAEKKENKTLEEYLFQYRHAQNYVDRREAIVAALKAQAEVNAVEILREAIKDPYAGLRNFAVAQLDMKKQSIRAALESALATIAEKDKDRPTRASAINKLGELAAPQYRSLFLSAVNDSSYTVSGNALEALYQVDSSAAVTAAKRLSLIPSKARLSAAISKVMIASGDESAAETVLGKFEQMPLSQEKFQMLASMKDFLKKMKNPAVFRRGIDDIVAFKKLVPEAFRDQINPVIDGWLKEIQTAKAAAGETALAAYVETKMKE
jgi:aminopeptidase N